MKNKTIAFLLACLFIPALSVTCKAQHESPSEARIDKKDAEAVRNNKMIVILLDEDKEYISKMTKKDKMDNVKNYTEAILYYNNTIKELAAKYLTFPKEIDFKYFSKIRLMPIEERKNCSFLGITINSRLNGGGDRVIGYEYDLYCRIPSSPIDKESFHFNKSDAEYCKLEIYTYRKRDTEPVFSKPIYHLIPTKADMIFSFTRANKLFESGLKGEKGVYKKKEENLKYLKEKTLAIREDDLSKKATRELISKNYPCPFELLPKEKIDSIFLNHDDKYAVLMFVNWQFPDANFYHQEILDIATGDVIYNLAVAPAK